MSEVYLGVPGSGKTRTLLDIVDDELTRTRPDRIAYLSFTRRARIEALERAQAKFGLSENDLIHFRTIHSLAFRHIGISRNEVVTGDALREFAAYAGVELTTRRGFSEDGEFWGSTPGDRALHMIGLAHARRVPLRDLYDEEDDDLSWHELDRLARFYSAFKAGRGALDFSDILDEFLRCGGAPKLDVLIVDEAQDLSIPQWEVVDRLAAGCRRVVIAGDDDQALFVWGGADVASLLRRGEHATVLGQSHRVPRAVHALADDVIRNVRDRHPKAWQPRDAEGLVSRSTSLGDVDLDEGDTLILVRNARFATDRVVPELRHRGIPYEWRESPPVAPEILAAIRVWEDLRAGRAVTPDAARGAYEWGSVRRHHSVEGGKLLRQQRNDEPLTMDALVARYGLLTQAIWHQALDKIPPDETAFVLAARRRGEKLLGPPRVRVSTIHGAKGAQAEHVVILNSLTTRTHREMEKDEASELRVLYTGLTRSQDRLTIVDGEDDRVWPWV